MSGELSKVLKTHLGLQLDEIKAAINSIDEEKLFEFGMLLHEKTPMEVIDHILSMEGDQDE